METKFNFNSQVCTDKNQSERLLELGLKPETADCTLIPSCDNDGTYIPKIGNLYLELRDGAIPAWSLGRLIKLMPRTIVMHFPTGEAPDTPIEREVYALDILISDDSIAEAVSTIEWLIKEGYLK